MYLLISQQTIRFDLTPASCQSTPFSTIFVRVTDLIAQAIINYGKEKSAARTSGTKEPNLGRGIGMAIALFLLVVIASVARHQVRVHFDLLYLSVSQSSISP